MDSANNLVGIDLGTTMSVIAHLDPNGDARTISNEEGEPLTPSAIYVDGKHAIVGKAAKQASAVNPEKVAMFVKREIGQPVYSRTVDRRRFRPETLSAIILRKLKQDAERKIGPIRKAVITVPAFFDDVRRKATQDAGKIAGLDVLDIINEPTAAALAYCRETEPASKEIKMSVPEGQRTVLVYDLGGGTFDVTVVRLTTNHFHTVATDGAVQLGGKDWDDAIIEHIRKEYETAYGVDPAVDGDWRTTVASLAEASKKLLSKLPTVPVETFHQGRALKLSLDRTMFEDFTRNLLTQTEVVTDLLVGEQAGLTWDEIDRVLLVGGSTRMPMVKEMLERVTGAMPDDSLDPDQIVARGAAVFAGIHVATTECGLEMDEALEQELGQVIIENVSAHSLGIEAARRVTKELVNAIMIPKNTQLPFAASKVFRTNRPDARNVRVKVLEGEAPEASANIVIGECLVTKLPPRLPERSPIQVRLNFGTNGRVGVMALDMTGGRFAEAEIQRGGGLTEEDLVREAQFVQSFEIH